jgi:hypothetical protein
MSKRVFFAIAIYASSTHPVLAQVKESTECLKPENQSAQPKEGTKSEGEANKSNTSAKKLLQSLGSSDPLIENALNVLDDLIDETRTAQTRIYLAARGINRNLDQVKTTNAGLLQDIDEARSATKELIAKSYSDAIFQRKNLDDQIKTRLSNLVADSALMAKCPTEHLMKDFLHELTILKSRFVSARQFRAGIGAEYIYLPRITYAASSAIDLSQFQTPGVPLGGHTGFLVEFSNFATRAARIVASGSGLDVALTSPTQDQTREIITNVSRALVTNGSDNPDLLYKTTLTSRIKPRLDASISASINYIVDSLRSKKEDERERQRVSYHLGIGMTGFRIDETSSTEVRLRSDPSKSFVDLQKTGVTTSNRSISFKAPYWNADARFLVSDESQIAISYRKYFRSNSSSETQPRVSGNSISIYFVWLPTFGW